MKSATQLLLASTALLSASCTAPSVMGVKPELPDLPDLSGIRIPLLAEEEKPEATVDFYQNIKPLLEKRCLACHNSSNAARGLNLESRETANTSWRGGPVIVPEHPDRSMMYQVTLLDTEGSNSPHAIPYEEGQLIYTWIDEGAHWPEEATLQPAAGTP